MVRGNQRQKTFLGDTNYQAYLERLARYRKYRKCYGYTVHAWIKATARGVTGVSYPKTVIVTQKMI